MNAEDLLEDSHDMRSLHWSYGDLQRLDRGDAPLVCSCGWPQHCCL